MPSSFAPPRAPASHRHVRRPVVHAVVPGRGAWSPTRRLPGLRSQYEAIAVRQRRGRAIATSWDAPHPAPTRRCSPAFAGWRGRPWWRAFPRRSVCPTPSPCPASPPAAAAPRGRPRIPGGGVDGGGRAGGPTGHWRTTRFVSGFGSCLAPRHRLPSARRSPAHGASQPDDTGAEHVGAGRLVDRLSAPGESYSPPAVLTVVTDQRFPFAADRWPSAAGRPPGGGALGASWGPYRNPAVRRCAPSRPVPAPRSALPCSPEPRAAAPAGRRPHAERSPPPRRWSAPEHPPVRLHPARP